MQTYFFQHHSKENHYKGEGGILCRDVQYIPHPSPAGPIRLSVLCLAPDFSLSTPLLTCLSNVPAWSGASCMGRLLVHGIVGRRDCLSGRFVSLLSAAFSLLPSATPRSLSIKYFLSSCYGGLILVLNACVGGRKETQTYRSGHTHTHPHRRTHTHNLFQIFQTHPLAHFFLHLQIRKARFQGIFNF